MQRQLSIGSIGSTSSDKPSIHHGGFGTWTAVSFTVNYILGCGFLSIPNAFYASGVALGPIVVLIFGFIMTVTKDFILEAMGRAESLFGLELKLRDAIYRMKEIGSGTPRSLSPRTHSPRLSGYGTASDSRSTGNDLQLDGDISESEYLVSTDRTFEITDLFAMFVSPLSRMVYALVLSGYLYISLWAYGTVFASSFAANIPVSFLNNGQTCNIETEGSVCLPQFFFWFGMFTLMAVPLSCMNLKEQVVVQVLMFFARLVVILMMIGTILNGYKCDGVVFVPPAIKEDASLLTEKGSIPLFNFAGLGTVIPVVIYAFIFHHSVPILSEPVKDKRSLPKIFLYAFIIVGVCYLSLGIVVAVWFGADVMQQCNLNWQNYVGCVVPAEGQVVTADDASKSAIGIRVLILIFPALDILSAYPLNAITLGTTLLSAFYSEKLPMGSSMRLDSSMTDGSTLCGLRRSTVRRIIFRLLAAVPPLGAGALSTYLGMNLTQIVTSAGLIGVLVAFAVPSVLRIFSYAKHRSILKQLGRLPLEQEEATYINGRTSRIISQQDLTAAGFLSEIELSGESYDRRSSLETEDERAHMVSSIGPDATVQEIENAVQNVLGSRLNPRLLLKSDPIDKYLKVSPYTSFTLKYFRMDFLLFLFSVGIGIFVLVSLIMS